MTEVPFQVHFFKKATFVFLHVSMQMNISCSYFSATLSEICRLNAGHVNVVTLFIIAINSISQVSAYFCFHIKQYLSSIRF